MITGDVHLAAPKRRRGARQSPPVRRRALGDHTPVTSEDGGALERSHAALHGQPLTGPHSLLCDPVRRANVLCSTVTGSATDVASMSRDIDR
jgi:hypothetical protein